MPEQTPGDRLAGLSPEQRARLVEALRRERLQKGGSAIPPRPAGHPPLSLPQQRLWFLERLAPGTWTSHVAVAWRLAGPLDVAALARGLNEIESRHEALRTTFHLVDERAVQIVAPPQSLPLPRIDLDGLPSARREEEARRLADREALRVFDLARGPLWRPLVLRLDAHEHVLLLTFHHLVSDGWSIGVLLSELAALYGAFTAGRPSPLPELPIHYGDFAAWQQGRWERGDFEPQLDDWIERLAGCPPVLALPTDRPRPPVQTQRAGLISVSFPADPWQRCEALGRRLGATPFMVCLAAYAAVLGQVSGQDDLAVGSPVGSRQPAETEKLIGLFVNTLVLRVDLKGDPSFAELLRRVRAAVLAAQAHGEVPFEKLVETLRPPRDLAYAPLVQVMLAFEESAGERPALAGLSAETFPLGAAVALFDVTLGLIAMDGGLKGWWDYNADLFDAATIERWAAAWERLLLAAADEPDRRLSDLPFLSAAERRQAADRRPLSALTGASPDAVGAALPPRDDIERSIAAIWCDVLGREKVGIDESFFDVGGHSLLLVRVHARLVEQFPELVMVDLFKHPTVRRLASCLRAEPDAPVALVAKTPPPHAKGSAVAVIGLAGRFPGAGDIEAFWRNLSGGVESISFFTAEELLAEGVSPALVADPGYVRANGVLDGADLFDADFFGIAPREAEVMDPQHRLLLEIAWEALEDAGRDPARADGRVGVFAGISESSYLRVHASGSEAVASVGPFQASIANSEAFAVTRVSYKLDLRGPSLHVQTACSTSLVAVHLACRSLLAGECDVALAGGAGILFPQRIGYRYQERGIASPDGHCRAFDVRAAGTIGGNGGGLVVLKRLADAVADGDRIRAVIRGTAINNDGAGKVGFTAPAVDGQAEVIAAALAAAGAGPETIGLIEAHGSGTPLGDPIEVAALHQVFGVGAGPGSCALGSVKTNIGHLDAAAGAAGLIKAVLAVERGVRPPSLHFESPNPAIDFAAGPFFVPKEATPWPAGPGPRRAGVSSFGMGGTNAHAVIEEAPPQPPQPSPRPWQLLVLSARSAAALDAATDRLAQHLAAHPDVDPADVAWTLQTGRRAFAHRRILVGRDVPDLAAALVPLDAARAVTAVATETGKPVALLFPGLGDVRPGMFGDLWRTEAGFRAEVERCVAFLPDALGERIRELFAGEAKPGTGLDLRRLVRPGATQDGDWWSRTEVAQPALFIAEYALARLWMDWGVPVAALLGYSLGEYVAACLAGVLTLEEALPLVVARARLLASLPAGAMLAVPLSEERTLALPEVATGVVALAAINGPEVCVLSGDPEAITAVEHRLAGEGVPCQRLAATQAFHAPAVEAVREPLLDLFRAVDWKAPRIPVLSGLTGTWLTAAEATNPEHWYTQTRRTVRLGDSLGELLRGPDCVLLEVGPGQALSILARQHPDRTAERPIIASAPHRHGGGSDAAFLLEALGRLWLAGVDVDWKRFHAVQPRRKVSLPTYPFERRRYWIDVRRPAPQPASRPALADWFYAPAWKPAPRPRTVETAPQRWLVVGDVGGLGEALAAELRLRGYEATVQAEGSSQAVLREHQPDGIAWLCETGSCDPSPHPEQAESALLALFSLVQALGEHPLELVVVTAGAQAVTGSERLAPERAALAAACRVIPREHAHVACRSIDLPLEESPSAKLLADELLAGPAAPAVAWRGGRRWIEGFEQVRLEPAGAADLPLRERGVYLVTGGLGGIGLALAGFLARQVRARLVLVGRTAPQDHASRHITSMEELGAEVLALSADVADAGRMREVLDTARRRFGEIDGVIHCAGVPGGGLIQLRTPDAVANVFAAKVRGAFVLAELLCGRRLDFLALCSSLTAVLGGVGQADYCAANAVLDAFASWYAGETGTPTVSIGWDAWKDTGMALAGMPEDEAAELLAGELRDKLVSEEGVEAFRRVLAAGLPHVLVSTADLDTALARAQEVGLAEVAAQAGRSTHPRPALARPYVAPRDETEKRLAVLWQEVLGVDPVGVHDELTELGGHSLLALQLLWRMRGSFGVDLALGALFEAPTVATMAAILRDDEAPRPAAVSPLVPLQTTGGGDKPPLFLVHPAGGGLSGYRDLALRLGADRPVWGLQSPGLMDGGEPPADLETMAALYVEAVRSVAPAGPYLLGAWSMGGLIAYEMARQLTALGEEVALLALIDAHVPVPGLEDPEPEDDAALLADLFRLPPVAGSVDDVLATARQAGTIGEDFGPAEAGRLLHVFRANVAAVEAYRPRPWPGRALLLRCREALPSAPAEPTLGWGALATGGVEVVYVPGGHGDLVFEPHAAVLAERLRACLAGPAALHQLFERWADCTPDAVAVVLGDDQLSCGELERRANRLARHLRAAGVGPEVLVGLALDRSLDLVTVALAVLKAGGAYLPLDLTYPPERLDFMIRDAGTKLLLTRSTLNESREEISRESAERLSDGTGPDNLAYVIYTSGSTGRPKGVQVPHRGLLNVAAVQLETFAATPDSRVAQFASWSFDASAFDLLMAWGAGAALCLVPEEARVPGPALVELLRRHRITHATLSPSVLAGLPSSAELPDLAALVVAGEACPQAVVDHWAIGGRRFWNAYGPTEATIWATVAECSIGERPPIGAPIDGVRAAVLDAGFEPAETGELYLGGIGVTRGYLGRPALTAERFVPDAWSGEPGARLYATGDLVRRRPDDALDFLGRIDHQVKIRGLRVELGEIESLLDTLPGVSGSAVLAVDERLVAYIVPAGDSPTLADLRKGLRERLPEHMVPSTFVVLDAWPLTPSGKVDRPALPRPERGRRGDADLIAPRTPEEEALATIWRDILGLEELGVRDDLLELGAHSLVFGRFTARVREELGRELPLREIFDHPTVAGLAACLQRAAALPPLPPITAMPREGLLPLSFAQERIWFLEQLSPGILAYNAQAELRFRGPLDPGLYARVLAEVVRRHEVLRTGFPEVDGQPVQVIHPPYTPALPLVDLIGLPAAIRETETGRLIGVLIQQPFDTTRPPLVRCTLLRLNAEEHALLHMEHHIVHDGWSFGVFLAEIEALYEAFATGRPSPLPEPPIQYADYALWQRQWMRGEVLDRHLSFWRQRLAGSPPLLELPTDRPRPRVQRFRGAGPRITLPRDLYTGLRTLARREGVTLYTVMLAAFDALLQRYAGCDDVLVGAGVANRRARQLEGMIGMVVNTLVLRTSLAGDPSWRELLRRVRDTVVEAREWEDMPFEQLVRELAPGRDLDRNPLFQVMFGFHDAAVPDLDFAGLRGTVREIHNGSAKTDINIVGVPRAEQRVGRVGSGGEDLVLIWEYRTDLFDAATIERMIGHYRTLLSAALAEPERRLSELPLLGDEERRQVLGAWSGAEAGHIWPREASIPELFAAVAAASPDAVAIECGTECLTYGELDRRGHQLAWRLRALGVGPDTAVGLAIERSPELIVGMLGILQAGGCYVPLDLVYPAERLAWMAADAGLDVVVTCGGAPLDLHVATVVDLRGEAWEAPHPPGPPLPSALPASRERGEEALPESLSAGAPLSRRAGGRMGEGSGVRGQGLRRTFQTSPDSLAYVMYTSGSTGQPKGVAVTHRGVVRLARGGVGDGDTLPGPEEVLLHIAPPSFDASTFEVWWTLLHGGRLAVLRERTPSLAELGEAVVRHRVTTLHLTAGLFHQVVDEHLEGLRTVPQLLTGGDVVSASHVRRALEALPGRRLVHCYGPTENTTFTCCHVMAGPDEAPDPLPIGRPIAGTRVYLLDSWLRPVPTGVPGELLTGGDGLARGYLGRPGLTAERFIPDPLTREPGARLYRTGDLARFRPSGAIEFLGRIDRQVKVRGFRIEPGEVESALASCPGIGEAVVVVRDDAAEKSLVAYLTPSSPLADEAAGTGARRRGPRPPRRDAARLHGALGLHGPPGPASHAERQGGPRGSAGSGCPGGRRVPGDRLRARPRPRRGTAGRTLG